MSQDSIQIKVSASVANVSCGFDCIGYSVSEPADILTISLKEKPGIEIIMSGYGSESISILPGQNTAGKGILSLLTALDKKQGFTVHIEKGIPPGSGLGSSAASAVGGVFGANQLLGAPFLLDELLVHCMAGEAVASGGFHADNVAPALLGGIQLIRSYDPLDIISLPVPEKLMSTVVLPELTINTKEARAIVPKHVPIKSAVEQAGSLAGFTSGLYTGDFDLLGRSMVDLLAEPYRHELIPGFHLVRQAALDAGAIGCGISGSGPALFAFSDSLSTAEKVEMAMVNAFKIEGLLSQSFSSPIQKNPPMMMD
ncbi:MAG: homoserine kinase [Fidelibacterota bacterium]